MDREGAICDVTARQKAVVAKFSARVVQLDPGKSIDLELSGDLIGN